MDFRELDITGVRFGRWLAIRRVAPNKWECRCDCGTEAIRAASNLRTGRCNSCGCANRVKSVIGQSFHRLTVIGEYTTDRPPGKPPSYRRPMLICRCECGNQKHIIREAVLKGKTKSCGCWQAEFLALCRQHALEKNATHLKSHLPEHSIWQMIKQRCNTPHNPSYPRYGGRGIRMCERWERSFQAFLDDMGPRPSPDMSVDRWPDRRGNYEPSNCRWATHKQQRDNQDPHARPVRHTMTLDGVTKPVYVWAREIGIDSQTLMQRRRRGWDDLRALTEPLDPIGRGRRKAA